MKEQGLRAIEAKKQRADELAQNLRDSKGKRVKAEAKAAKAKEDQ